MVSVTSASPYVTSASRYQSRFSMYIRGLIPRKCTDLAEAVPIANDLWSMCICADPSKLSLLDIAISAIISCDSYYSLY